MDWIFEHIQVLIAVAAGIVFWLNKSREEREQRRQMEEEGPAEWEEEEFGPAEEEPPPPNIVIHRRTPPPLPPAVSAEAERQRDMLERLKTLRAGRTAWAAAKKAPSPKTAAAAPADLQSLLRDRGEIRRAVVLREILGPPVGLR